MLPNYHLIKLSFLKKIIPCFTKWGLRLGLCQSFGFDGFTQWGEVSLIVSVGIL